MGEIAGTGHCSMYIIDLLFDQPGGFQCFAFLPVPHSRIDRFPCFVLFDFPADSSL